MNLKGTQFSLQQEITKQWKETPVVASDIGVTPGSKCCYQSPEAKAIQLEVEPQQQRQFSENSGPAGRSSPRKTESRRRCSCLSRVMMAGRRSPGLPSGPPTHPFHSFASASSTSNWPVLPGILTKGAWDM